jgi:hypothetical protein
MPMLCLAGSYRILATEPDGDSIRFYPDDAAQWSLVPGRHAVQTNAGGSAQLRLDGIDALETHYTARGSHRCTSRSRSRTRPPTSCCGGWGFAAWNATASG